MIWILDFIFTPMAKRLMYGFCLSALMFMVTSCHTSRKNFNASKKFPAESLRKDYTLLREIMERFHPALYWYTPKDSMDYYFDQYYKAITDSMTLQQFGFKILAPLTTKVRCGHTSFNYPPGYNKWQRKHDQPSFPLFMKIWPDTMVLTVNLNKKDSLLQSGMLINSVNGLSVQQLTDTLFQFMPADGYSENVNYIRLSAAFPYYHRNIMGLSKKYVVGYTDSAGVEKSDTVPIFYPGTDSVARKLIRTRNKQIDPEQKAKKWEDIRSMQLDTAHQLALMTINSFGNKGRLPAFYKKSFKNLRKKNIPNLVIDLRGNGGGKVNNYTSLAKYVRNTPFKVADTAVAMHNGLAHYNRYFRSGLINSFILFFVTKKKEDGNYHFSYWEKHVFNPRKKNHYKGNVFVLINGPTFSASTLFAHTVKGQSNVTLVGEEAGGGWHGNSGILIPDVVLPKTKMRVRMPLFRLVQYNHVPKDGRGVMPDIYVPPTVENVRKHIDGKMQKVVEIIEASSVKP